MREDAPSISFSEDEVLRLYQRANAQQWNPDKEIDWQAPIGLDGEKKKAWIELMKVFYGLELMGLFVLNNLMNEVGEKSTEGIGNRHLNYYLSIQGADEARHIYCLEKYLDKLGSGPGSRRFQQIINGLGKLASKGFIRHQTWALSTLFSENFASHFMATALEKDVEPLGSEIFRRIIADEARHISLQHLLCRRIPTKVGFFGRWYLKLQSYATVLLTAWGVRRIARQGQSVGIPTAPFIASFMSKLEKQEEALGLNGFVNPRFQRKIFKWFLPKPKSFAEEEFASGWPVSKSFLPSDALSGETPVVSVVVPALNEEKYLPACLESLLRQEGEIPYEIIVVDNGSTDQTPQIVRAKKARLVVETDRGLTRAREAGFRAARGRLIAYLDADSLAPSDWIVSIEKAFRRFPEAVALCGTFRYQLKSPLHRAAFWAYFNIVERAADWILRGQRLAGGNFAVRREALEKIHGFNLEIEFYGEDLELANRLKRIGRIRPMDSMILSSGRRFDHKGLLVPGFIYLFNYLWLLLFKKPCFNFYDEAEGEGSYKKKPSVPVDEEEKGVL